MGKEKMIFVGGTCIGGTEGYGERVEQASGGGGGRERERERGREKKIECQFHLHTYTT